MRKIKFTSNEYEAVEREKLEKLYSETMTGVKSDFRGKDLEINSSVPTRIIKINENDGIAYGETQYGQSISININREEKILNRLGYPNMDISIGRIIDVVVNKNSRGEFNGSVSAGYEKALKKELLNAIKDQNCAFKVKVTTVCNGGFMVDLSGIQCFLPGSLAAANRIMDFNQYVGKNITVMVEMYDQKRDIFVVSFKKYLRKIINNEVQNLSFSNKYNGYITGSSNNGLFIEWDEIFTGIISYNDENRAKLSELKTGDPISFYVIDIKNPQRIILSLTEPNEKLKNIQDLKDSSGETLGEELSLKSYKGEITKIKTFGVFIKLDNGLTGLIEKEKLINDIKEYSIGQSINCIVSNVDLSTFKIQLIEGE